MANLEKQSEQIYLAELDQAVFMLEGGFSFSKRIVQQLNMVLHAELSDEQKKAIRGNIRDKLANLGLKPAQIYLSDKTRAELKIAVTSIEEVFQLLK